MFGSTLPLLPEKMRSTVQTKIDELKHESTGSPFGPFGEDIELARLHRERFLQGDHARCKCLREYVRFLERKGFIPGEDFASLRRIADERGRAIWTTLNTADAVKDAIAQRADERLKEEMKLWGDKQEYRIAELKEKVKEQEAGLSKTKSNLEKANENKIAASNEESQRIDELRASLAEARRELRKSSEKVKVLEEENARHKNAVPTSAPAPPPLSETNTTIDNSFAPLSSSSQTTTQYISSSSAPSSKGAVTSTSTGSASVSSSSTVDPEDGNLLSKDDYYKKKKKWSSVPGKKKK